MDHQLLVFTTVVEKKNFSRAAEELHMTQPAVSQYIQSLEQQIGTRLLERSNKFVRLNMAGEIVYHHAKEILSHYTRMQYLVDDLMNKASGDLFIGASYSFGEYVLPGMISDLLENYPLIKPSITIRNSKRIVDLVVNNELEIGIVEGEFNQQSLNIEPFADDLMYVTMSANHRFANQSIVTKEELEAETWIVREEGSGTREATDKMFDRLQLNPQHKMEFGSTQVIKESVESGIGISLLSKWAIQRELSSGTLRLVEYEGLPVRRKFSIVTRTVPFQTKAMELFLKMLRDRYR
ncbi:LysR family transcriptional regulator [Chengkuizengella axinellae]|uniref:LysR family transcriptional regulator n=1 Tax=Chengkuizengella axinellae TaxID=3064388 RepID=A0ABT9J0I8_9BACL|nr:LysR family transcriptional regulator [Chengkuizengella sp. 2205SS18-9]MDP5275134.1 LysR family transcriptional regulator [Chengkuizengella sp. 2205SS18-9]